MSSIVDQPSPIDQQDPVGSPNGAFPVRDGYHGFALGQRVKRLLDLILVFRIGKCRRLVENDNRRVLQQHSGD